MCALQFPVVGAPITLDRHYCGVINSVMLDFMSKTLMMDPEKRYNTAQCLQHPAFQVNFCTIKFDTFVANLMLVTNDASY